jgi:hypothetical protein
MSHVGSILRVDTTRTLMPKVSSSKLSSMVSTTSSVDKEPQICLPGRAIFAVVVPAREHGTEEVRCVQSEPKFASRLTHSAKHAEENYHPSSPHIQPPVC